MADDPPPSQASSHFPIEPVSASLLAARERCRRDALWRRGAVVTGCWEVDEGALLGGLERGCVTGISAEDESFGMRLAFQAVARSLAEGGQRAVILTTLAAAGILPLLRDAVRARLLQVGKQGDELRAAIRECLGKVSVATVFDLEGVWEVLDEVDGDETRETVEDKAGVDIHGAGLDVGKDTRQVGRDANLETELKEKTDEDELGAKETAIIDAREEDMLPPPATQNIQTDERVVLPELTLGTAEIADSEDEDFISSLSSSPLSSPPASSLGSVPPGLGLNEEETVADDALDAASSPMSVAGSSANSSTDPIDAVLQVLAPLDASAIKSGDPPHHSDEMTSKEVVSSSPGSPPAVHAPSPLRSKYPSPATAEKPTVTADSSRVATSNAPIRATSTAPDIILITHFSTLLTTLFARQDKSAAHNSINLLSSHLRHLSRTLPTSPLILLLNTTAPSLPGTATPAVDTPSRKPSSRPLDPTLRSVFNPPPLTIAGYQSAASRRNKPSFGMVFAQMLDLHLLCTRVPRTAEDAERIFGDAPGDARFVWVVEVLLDEIGVWGGQGKGPRRSREQRWGAVDVVGGSVVDAFEPKAPAVPKEIRLAAGFGGPRV
ncbi:hypothetical protein HYQ44_004908 [Verticillium longisporum]|nr:hypothetical protein HYQ44_004908 [Verticillium longisporum]